MDFHTSWQVHSNKFMYVNQGLLNKLQQSIGQPKVLINPNFVGVRPHLNKQFLHNQNIHINPNVFRQVEKPKAAKVLLTTPTKLIRVPQSAHEAKLVRESAHAERPPIHTKYKIVRNSAAAAPKQELQVSRLHGVKNQFKIDRRIKPALGKRPVTPQSPRLMKLRLVNINGMTYRRSSKSLVILKRSKTRKLSKGGKEKLLTIRGQQYKLDASHRTLTLLAKDENSRPNFKTVFIQGVAFRQRERNVFVKINVNQKQISTSPQTKQQRNANISKSKMKKSNLPCPTYHKYGKCKGKERGTCIQQHNPNQISLCPKFLQGACLDSKCLLSHDVSSEKMPTCKFFLEGLCSRDDCPYLHVKINARADICKDFLEGFCRKAAEVIIEVTHWLAHIWGLLQCDKRHQYLCPDFEKSGKCKKRSCPYPHGDAARFKGRNKKCPASNADLDLTTGVEGTDSSEKMHIRYYDESTNSSSTIKETKKSEVADLDADQTQCLPSKGRPQLGVLPSFIPLLNKED